MILDLLAPNHRVVLLSFLIAGGVRKSNPLRIGVEQPPQKHSDEKLIGTVPLLEVALARIFVS